MSAILLYPSLNIMYTMFLPKDKKAVLGYTIAWMAAMMIFEYFSVMFGTVVFTGWTPFPWSVVTYVVTYLWVYLTYRYLSKRDLRENFCKCLKFIVFYDSPIFLLTGISGQSFLLRQTLCCIKDDEFPETLWKPAENHKYRCRRY